MKKEKPPETKLVSTRPLKYDLAMRQAAERAQYQPRMMSITSKSKDTKK